MKLINETNLKMGRKTYSIANPLNMEYSGGRLPDKLLLSTSL